MGDGRFDLSGFVIGVTAARSADAQAEQIRRLGGEPVIAPTLATESADAEQQRTAVGEFLDALAAGDVSMVILLTGVGTRALVAAATELGRRSDLEQGLRSVTVLARGYKCVAALRTFGRYPDLIPAEATTGGVIAELEAWTRAGRNLRGKQVFVQAYGAPAAELCAVLTAHGAETGTIPLYRYRLPDDEAPVLALLDRIAAGELDAVTFTSPPAASHLFLIAEAHERADLLRVDLKRPGIAVAAVGPSTAAALEAQGVTPHAVADPPRLFPMLERLAEHLAAVGPRMA
ncbi:MAG: uroporphyrinogen-III synthase [Chloroflexota bacterium]